MVLEEKMGLVAPLSALATALITWILGLLERILLPIVEAGYLPDFLIRTHIRLALAASLKELDKEDVEENMKRKMEYVKGASCA
jgi:hypothetical protein